MAELLILWGYIGIVNSCIGAGVLKGIGLLTGRKKIVYGLAGTELAGIGRSLFMPRRSAFSVRFLWLLI